MPAQLSLFSVGVRPPAYADLEGLLAGPGHVARRGGTARLSVLLPDPASWRVEALLAGMAELTLAGEIHCDELGRSVRTPFAADLVPIATRWARGAITTAPAGLALDGPRLRWWCLAAGHLDPVGYVLELGDDEASWPRIGAALAAAGVPGTFVRPRQATASAPVGHLDHEAYRIVGTRRRARLAELVGPPPPSAPPGSWPAA